MTLTINGQLESVADGLDLLTLLTERVGDTRGSAAAVDGLVVPRREWPDYQLSDGQTVELLTAVQGG